MSLPAKMNVAARSLASVVTPRRTETIARLLELLNTRQDQPFRMAEICEALGVSERTLHDYSVGLLGMSPGR